jgi:hypothetical protein
MIETLPQPVVNYLEQLEKQLKQKAGVVPEDALADAREHLFRDYNLLLESQPSISQAAILEQFIAKYGDPVEVAEAYEESTSPQLLRLPGYAPGWRISCTKCGRSAPAAKAGITRIGAVSVHKCVVGWCRDCRWLRWMRIEKDMNDANLTRGLGVRTSPQTLRAKRHWPWAVVMGIVVTVLLIVLLVGWQAL